MPVLSGFGQFAGQGEGYSQKILILIIFYADIMLYFEGDGICVIKVVLKKIFLQFIFIYVKYDKYVMQSVLLTGAFLAFKIQLQLLRRYYSTL